MLLLVLENRPPISSSASKEKARRCRDHFFLGFLGCFSEAAASSGPRFLLFLAQKKKRRAPAIAATTMGTAIAALRAEEHETLLQELCETSTAPLVLLAAFVAVVEARSFRLVDAMEVTEVLKVVDVIDAGDVATPDVESVAAAEAAAEVFEVSEAVDEVARLLAPRPVCIPVVCVNSLSSDEARLSRMVVPGPPGLVMPVNPALSGGAMLPKAGGVNGGVNKGLSGTLLRPTRGLEGKWWRKLMRSSVLSTPREVRVRHVKEVGLRAKRWQDTSRKGFACQQARPGQSDLGRQVSDARRQLRAQYGCQGRASSRVRRGEVELDK